MSRHRRKRSKYLFTRNIDKCVIVGVVGGLLHGLMMYFSVTLGGGSWLFALAASSMLGAVGGFVIPLFTKRINVGWAFLIGFLPVAFYNLAHMISMSFYSIYTLWGGLEAGVLTMLVYLLAFYGSDQEDRMREKTQAQSYSQGGST